MRRALPLLALLALAAFGLTACGDAEETTVVSTTTVSSTDSTVEDPDGAPAGVMTADGIGEASVGDSAEDVTAALGEPDAEEELPGCELGTHPVPLRQLAYELEDGELAVNIDSETNRMTSYFTDSSELATDHGDSVGDSWESLEASWSVALDPVVLGAKPTPELGSYKVGPDGANQLIFDLEDRAVVRISGGFLPPCE